jgi:hypothetical protein
MKTRSTSRPRRCAVALLAAAAALTGRAETSPYYLGVSQTFGRDSNVFRVPDRTEVAVPGGGVQVLVPESSGLTSTTLLLAGLDQAFGRQRLYGNLSAGYSSYADQPQLDGPRYALLAGLDWATVERLSGNVEFTSGRRLGAYGDRDVPAGRGDNDERYNRLALLGRYGDWQRSSTWLEATLVYDQVSNDISFLQLAPYSISIDPITGQPITRFSDGYQRDERSTALSLGVRHRWSGALVLGAGLRTESRTRDIERHLVNPTEAVKTSYDSRRQDLDLLANFDPGLGHYLSARLSYGSTDYADPGALDYTGWSGSLNWAWQPTGKLDSKLRLLYDTEDREGGGASAAASYGDRKTLALEWRLRYALSAKLNADLSASRYQRTYTYQGGFTDHDTTASLTLSWSALRGCTAGIDRRTSNLQGAFEGRSSYNASLFSCFGQLTLQ